MKALCIDPEYAFYLFTGEQTIDCRTWSTDYRGEVLICPNGNLVTDCICDHAYFVANLINVEPFTEEHFEAAKMEAMPSGHSYAWHFEDPALIYPIPVSPQLGLFDVDDSLIRFPDDELPDDAPDEEIMKVFKDFQAKYLAPITYSPDEEE